MSNGMEGMKMSLLEEWQKKLDSARAAQQAHAKKKGRQETAPPVMQITPQMRREAKERDATLRQMLPDY